MSDAEITAAREALELAARMVEFRRYIDIPVPATKSGPFTTRQQIVNAVVRQAADAIRAMAVEMARPDHDDTITCENSGMVGQEC